MYLVGTSNVMVPFTEHGFKFPEQLGHSLPLCRLGQHTAGLGIQFDQVTGHVWRCMLLHSHSGGWLLVLDVLDVLLLHCY